MLKPRSPGGAGPPFQESAGTPSSGHFRRPTEPGKAHRPSNSQLTAAPKVLYPEPFDGEEPGCRCLVKVLCSPGGDSLEETHRFLSGYTRSRFHQQTAQRLSVAGYELLSNALNYSSMADEVTIELLEAPHSAAFRVTNETIAPRIGLLTEHLVRIRTSAEATLIEEMRRSVAGGSVRPMLGLARVVHEASMQLDVLVEGRRVTMTASSRK